MQIIKTNPSRYTSNYILLREKVLLQQSVHRLHFNHQVLRLRPLENTLYSGLPATLVLTDSLMYMTRLVIYHLRTVVALSDSL